MRRAGLALLLPALLASCASHLPTVDEANQAVLTLRQHGTWAWAVGIALVCADLVLPVPQTAVIAALGIVYGVAIGGGLGTVALVGGGVLGYGLMRTSARRLVLRAVGEPSLLRMQTFFERAGPWTIVLTRSLPYSIPEIFVCLAGLAGMPWREFLVALALGSLPTAFVYAAIGAGLAERPLLALGISWALPIVSLPLALQAMRRRGRARR
jgi:uncharacterized membrane protein YdjX (TVP38/TMEM64 family)